jgi:D-alanyl-D-alanine carboxypeptidase
MSYRAAGLLLVVAAAIAASVGLQRGASSSSTAPSTRRALEAVPSTVWPAYGQAAFIRTGQSQIHAGPNQHAAPIASVAKVMTAYLVPHGRWA